MNLIFHAIQTRHQQGRKAQVGFISGSGKRASTTALGFRHKRNTDGRGTVLGRVASLTGASEVEPGAMAVGARVVMAFRARACLMMPANVVQGEIAQTGVAVASEQVLPSLPHGLVRACRNRCHRGRAGA